jgi:cellulose biosynthesis protein BcsQ
MVLVLEGPAQVRAGDAEVPAAGMAPLVVAVAHNKGGVGKTTSTLILGRYLSRRWRIELRDYDETAHLTDLVADLARGDRTTITRRLWLQDGTPRGADLVLIDSPPARGRQTRRALLEADFVLVPAPPERMAVRAMRQMFATIREIQADRQEGNPYLHILGVVPTLYTRQWPEHRDFLHQMAEVCAEERVRLFPPVARRQSYLYLSMHGQDYRPIADALELALEQHQRATVPAAHA